MYKSIESIDFRIALIGKTAGELRERKILFKNNQKSFCMSRPIIILRKTARADGVQKNINEVNVMNIEESSVIYSHMNKMFTN